MFKLRRFAFILGLCFVVALSGSAWALNATDHVSVAPNGKGDALIYPLYVTSQGWETKLSVTNTDLNYSVVAKVIFRSKANSSEVRDFLIYLSPSDVWTGTLYLNESDGLPHIRSTDSSVLSLPNTFASAETPLDIYLENACEGDTNILGYVEVIEAAAFSLNDIRIFDGESAARPVEKARIKALYDSVTDEQIRTVYQPKNVLTGFAEVSNTITNQFFSLKATVLKNYDNETRLEVARDTYWGQDASNSVEEVEAVLGKNNIALPYYSGAGGSVLASFTFPTKGTVIPNCVQDEAYVRGEYFIDNTPSPRYTLIAFDLDENSVQAGDPIFSPLPPVISSGFPAELNFITNTDLGVPFEEGWFQVTITDNGPTHGLTAGLANISYTGAPVIATAICISTAGVAGGWMYANHDDGEVTVVGEGATDIINAQYHYFEQDDN